MAEEQIPIEQILIESPFLKARALELIRRLRIKNAQELTGFSRKELGEASKNAGSKTIYYLGQCLQRVGLEFKPNLDRERSAIGRFGEAYAANIVFNVLRDLSEQDPQTYFASGVIVERAREYLNVLLYENEDSCRNGGKEVLSYEEVDKIFRAETVKAILTSGGTLEEYVEAIKILGGPRAFRLKTPRTKKLTKKT